jgi:hypothetical protein
MPTQAYRGGRNPWRLPIEYEHLYDRLLELRPAIEDPLPDEEKLSAVRFLSQFQADKALRQTLAEVLLATILWVEAGRDAHEILQDCEPVLRALLSYTVTKLLDFAAARGTSQGPVTLSRASLPDAWIRLLVEFRESLGRESDRWQWGQELFPYTCGKYPP